MAMRCPNCGSTAQVKLKEIFQADSYREITWRCGCGTEQVTRIPLSLLEKGMIKKMKEYYNKRGK